MDEQYKLVSGKILEFELHGNITSEQKATLSSAVSRLIHEAVRKRDALQLVDAEELETRVKAIKTVEAPHQIKGTGKRKIFIVHGHDQAMKEGVARVLEKLGLEPIILHEMPNMGRTIIGKFTDYSDVDYAVILLSPDDMGYLKEDGSKKAKSRARQNVILELGFFLGKISIKNVAVLHPVTLDFEMPSDYEGVI